MHEYNLDTSSVDPASDVQNGFPIYTSHRRFRPGLHVLGLLFAALLAGSLASCEVTGDNETDATEDIPTGTPATALFDYDGAMAGTSDTFYAFPFPSDLRVTEEGYPDLTGLPKANTPLVNNALDFVSTDRVGFSPLTAVYFQFDGPLDPNSFPDLEQSTEASSPVQLIDIDPESPDYLQRLPVYVTFNESRSGFWRDNMMAVRPMPGRTMRNGTRYAVVVTDGLRTADNGPVVASTAFQDVLDGLAAGAVSDHYEPVLTELEAAGVELASLVNISVFTTSDVVSEMLALREAVYAEPLTDLTDWEAGEPAQNHDVYLARFTTVEFFTGESPYDGFLGEGAFEFDENGNALNAAPLSVQLAITVPRTAPPANGYPTVVYGHGTGGDNLTHAGTNDEGGWLATEGIATIGFDAALHGDRVETPINVEGLITSNAVAAREVVRQTVVDTMVLYRLLREGRIVIPASVTGGDPITLDPASSMYMGHSQGSQEAGVMLAVEPEIDSAFLSAGGGGTVIAILEREFNGSPIACTIALVIGVECEELTEDSPVATLLVQPILDPADPLHFARHFNNEPLLDSPPRNIVMSEGTTDELTPPRTQEALAVAAGLPLIEPVHRTSDPIDLVDPPRFMAPVSDNIETPGGPATGGLLQWDGEGHFAIYDNADARYRYIQFFSSVVAGEPTVPGQIE